MIAGINRLHLDLTNRCTLKCSYCYVGHGNSELKNEMSKREWLQIIDQAAELGIKDFIISGGEPLFFSGILEIVKRVESCGATFSLMTNLWEIEEDILKTVLDSRALKMLITSLDGFSGHNITRPPSKWDGVVENVKLFREQRKDIKIGINTVLHRHNLTEVDALYNRIVGLAVNVWRLDVPIKPKDLSLMPDFSAAVEIAARLIRNRYNNSDTHKTELDLFRVYKSRLESIKLEEVISQTNISLHPCDYFLGTLAIKSDRIITLCSPMQIELGKIGEDINLNEVLQSVCKHIFFNMRVNNLQSCRNCKYLFLCGGGCRADALRWTGDLMEADPVSCLMMPLVEEKIIPILSHNLAMVYERLIDNNGKSPKYKKFLLERR